jgi:chemotaxis signal transduction protein
VPLERVVEVLPRVEITRLHGVEPPVAGYVRHRGRVVPVLDLRARLRQHPRVAPMDEHLLVVRVRRPRGGEGPIALLVDRVEGLIDLEPARVEPTDAGEHPVTGMVALPGGLLLVTDPDLALTLEEDRALRAALDAEEP